MKLTHRPKQLVQIGVIILALLAMLVIVWSARQIINQPDLGGIWTDSGDVYYVGGASQLEVGDRILAIDGTPILESRFPYFEWQTGDVIALQLERQGEELTLQLPYVAQAPLVILALNLMVVVIATIFVVVGTWVALFSPSTRQGWIFFLCCLTLGLGFALGSVTSEPWSAHLSLMMTWLTVSFGIHFHLLFPVKRLSAGSRWLLAVIYGVPLVGLVRLLNVNGLLSLPPIMATVHGILFYVWVLVGSLSVLILLSSAYRRATSTAVKRQVGLVAISGFLAVSPLLILTITPQLLYGAALLPTKLAFVFMIAIPIGYGYAINRYQFIRLERYISRSTAAVIVICLLSLFYYSIAALLRVSLDEGPFINQLLNLVIIMALAVAYHPLYRRLQNWVDYIFYGGWYDYSSVVGEVTHNLEKTNDLQLLAETLSQSVQKTMRVNWVGLLFQGQRPEDNLISSSGDHGSPTFFETLQVEQLSHIIAYFQDHLVPTTSSALQVSLEATRLSAAETQMLQVNTLHVWVPIRGLDRTLGLLLLGPKYGGDLFNAGDLEILDVVARQSSVAFQNVQLINQLEEKVRETERYQKEVNRAREEERKHISRELHDQVIQALVGLKYQFGNLFVARSTQENGESQHQIEQASLLQAEIGELIQNTRSLCQDLRPAALDLGLVPSIRSIVNRYEMQYGTEIDLKIDGDRHVPIHEDVALCLYRCMSEALANVQKHALAQNIQVQLVLEPHSISLSVQDDGRGFHVPERLGSLMEENHFGLVGMRERVELVDGEFAIHSEPRSGTCMRVTIPLTTAN